MARKRIIGETGRAKQSRHQHRNEAQLRQAVDGLDDDLLSDLTGYEMLWNRLPKLAEEETRVIRVVQPGRGVPLGKYIFAELYCWDPGCDCRRVVFHVLRRPRQAGVDTPPEHVLTIGYGWEPVAFYEEWLCDSTMSRDMKGPNIEHNSPPCSYGPELVHIFEQSSLSSPAYLAHLARHYRAFKESLAYST